ncbi:phage tail tape measure protein [Lentilactobacillus sp. TOM.63]|uniref:phage tail tape measure protein n=1 Tax=Lentilactobacillus sp. TOM.63 TaxID=3055077 RepID=UPI0025A0C9B1|nr:phage tail tape measure protein [Lentilactobacillus sp. TOM.63]MDM7515914.1 phage tail tape measure protein [Lentilactobacillus sp. TOM.63]
MATINDVMSTSIRLDAVQPARSLKTLTNYIKANTNAWRSQEVALKSSGDKLDALKTRYQGISEEIKGYNLKIDELKRRQSGLDQTTNQGSEKYAKYANQIAKAQEKIAGLNDQQSKAEKQFEYLNSGLSGLQRNYHNLNQVTNSYVDALKAQGKINQAGQVKLKGLKEGLNSLSDQYRLQNSELSKNSQAYKQAQLAYEKQRDIVHHLTNDTHKNADEYVQEKEKLNQLKGSLDIANEAFNTQQVRVNKTATSLANVRSDVVKYDLQVGHMSDAMVRLGDKANIAKNKFKNSFGSIKGSLLGASVAMGTLGAAAFSGAKKATELQNVYKVNQNLLVTGGDKAKIAIKTVTEMQKDGAKYALKYGVSQKEIADQYQDLIKRGHTGAESLAVMKTELQASVASSDDFKDVVKVSSQAIEAFGMKTNNTAKMMHNTKRVVNALAYSADMTATDFHSLGKGMEYVGDSAHNAGFSIEQTSAALGELSNHGLEADKAGTGLRKIITSLASPTNSAMGALNEIGIKSTKIFQTANGNFKTLPAIFKIIEEHTKKLGGADTARIFKNIFGPTGMQAAQILAKYNGQLVDLTNNVSKASKAGTYVQRLANKNAQTAQMSQKRFKQAWDQLSIMFGSKLLPYMTKAANQMTKLFGEKGFQKDIGKTATLTAHVAGGIANIGIFAVKHYEGVKHFGEALAAIWAVGKVYKYFKIFSDITSVFGGQKLKVNRLTSAYDDQTLAIERNTKAKEANVDAGNGTSAIDNVADNAGGEGKVTEGAEKDGKTAIHDIDDTSKVTEDTGKIGRFAKLAEKFKGVSKFGKVAAGSVGVLDILNSATDLIGMKKKTAGSHIGAATGSLGGTAAGAAIGTAILPGIGTAVGAGLGGLVGEGVGRKFGKAIQKGLSAQRIHTPKLSTNSSFKKLSGEATSYYKNRETQDKKNLQLLYKNGDITKKEYEKRLQIIKDEGSKANRLTLMSQKDQQAIAKYYAQSRQRLTESWNKKILKAENKYGKGSVQVEKMQKEKKEALEKQHLKFATQVTAKEAELHTTLAGQIKLSTNKIAKDYKTLTEKGKKYSKEKMIKLVANADEEQKSVSKKANDEYHSVYKAAWKKYKNTVKAADEEYKGNSSAAKAQRQKIIEEARKQRIGVINHAAKQKNDSITKAKQQSDKVYDYAHNQNRKVTAQAVSQYENIKKNNSKTKYNYSLSWHGIWKSVGNWIGKLVNGMNKNAISAQNKVFKQYGGSQTLDQIPTVAWATGTGLLKNGLLTQPVLAKLNDGHDSPETHNKEIIVHADGQLEPVEGKDTHRFLEAGSGVLNATESKMLMALNGMQHFASGTGLFGGIGKFFKGIWGSLKQKLSALSHIAKHSDTTFKQVFQPDFGDIKGTVGENFANMFGKRDKQQGSVWWDTAWNMLHGMVSGGGGQTDSAFLNEAKKLATRAHHRYSEGSNLRLGPNYYDCSGLVYETLKHMGITVPGGSTTVPEYKYSKPVSWKNAKTGDLAFFGRGGSQHVGIVVDNNGSGHMFSAENRKDGIKYSTIKGFGDFVGIRRVPGLIDKVKKSTKAHKQSSGLQALVKSQLKNSGVWSWVSKNLKPLWNKLFGNLSSFGLSGDWAARARTLAKALKKAYPAATDAGIAGILGNWEQESGLSPSAIDSKDHGTGLGQWTFIRETRLRNWLRKHGYKWNSAAGQLEYALREPGASASFRSVLRSNGTPSEAANKFFAGWESGGHEDSTGPKRESNARAIYKAIKGYANGGLVDQEQLIKVAERNKPETIIPWDINKRGRAYELLADTMAHFKQTDQHTDQSSNSNGQAVKRLEAKFDTMIKLMSQLVDGQNNPIPAVVTDKQVVQAVNKHNKRTTAKNNWGRGVTFG